MPFAVTWLDLDIVILSKVRERQISYGIAYMWNLKKGYNELIYKTEIELQMQEANLWLLGVRGGEDKLGDWD